MTAIATFGEAITPNGEAVMIANYEQIRADLLRQKSRHARDISPLTCTANCGHVAGVHKVVGGGGTCAVRSVGDATTW